MSAPADIYTLNYRRATQYAVQTIQEARELIGIDDESGVSV